MVAGGHDKSRMKQAMINRKADINAGETVVANSFGTNQLWTKGPDHYDVYYKDKGEEDWAELTNKTRRGKTAQQQQTIASK